MFNRRINIINNQEQFNKFSNLKYIKIKLF